MEKPNVSPHEAAERLASIRLKDGSSARKLGRGRANNVEVQAVEHVLSDDQDHSLEFAVKRCKDERTAAHSDRIYKECRDAGLSVPITCAIDKTDSRNLYMTDLTVGGKFLVESWSNQEFNDARITSISNARELAHEIVWNSIFATARNIEISTLYSDAPLFQFPPDGGNVPVHLVIADFDLVKKHSPTPFSSEKVRGNAHSLLGSVASWLSAREQNMANGEWLTKELSEEIERILPKYIELFSQVGSIDKLKRYYRNGTMSRVPEFVLASKEE